MLRVCHLWVTCGVSVDWTCSSLYPADASSDWKWRVCRLGEGLRLFIMYKPFLSSFCALPCWGWLMPLGILLPRVVCLIRNNVAGGWYLSIYLQCSVTVTLDNQLFCSGAVSQGQFGQAGGLRRTHDRKTLINWQCYCGNKYLSNNMHINWSFVPADFWESCYCFAEEQCSVKSLLNLARIPNYQLGKGSMCSIHKNKADFEHWIIICLCPYGQPSTSEPCFS